jgi:hypothetical protein
LLANLPSHGVIIPNGWDDAPYVAFGRQHQTNLLSLQIIAYDAASGAPILARNISAAYLNARFALTAAHNFEGLPQGALLTVSAGTGSNIQTNRGHVVSVLRHLVHPGRIPGNDSTPDVVILCLASNLPGPAVTITSASVGEVLTEAGFGYHGSAATGVTWDANSRAWNAPADDIVPSTWSPTYYGATRFYPYIPMNGQGYARDSGGPLWKLGNSNTLVGIGIGASTAVAEDGFTIYLKLAHPDIKSWIEQNTSLTPSLAIDADKRLSLTGNTNLLYGLEASTNLVDWQEIAVLTNTTGTVNFQDPNTTNFPMRAYRAVVK